MPEATLTTVVGDGTPPEVALPVGGDATATDRSDDRTATDRSDDRTACDRRSVAEGRRADEDAPTLVDAAGDTPAGPTGGRPTSDAREDPPVEDPPADQVTAPRPGLQERIEAHPAGRALVVAAIALVLATLAVNNLPDSPLRARLIGSVEPVERHTGLAQDWKLFAPDPSPVGVALVAEVRRADSSTGTWEPPVGGAAPFTAYRGYRWRKWASALARSENRVVLAAAAREVAAADEGAPTVEVAFYRVGVGEHASLAPRFLGRVDVDEPDGSPSPTEQAGAGS